MGSGASAGANAAIEFASDQDLAALMAELPSGKKAKIGDALNEARANKVFAFIFPMMPGDLNPSLPVARRLVELGHAVHYLCFEQFKGAIEDTGATFHSAMDYETELYSGRQADIFGAYTSLKEEHGLHDAGPYAVRVLLANVHIELQLPGVFRFLDKIGANSVVYDPIVNLEAPVAAQVRRLPAVALLAFAGPGGWADTVKSKLEAEGKTNDDFDTMAKEFKPNLEAIERLNKEYALGLAAGFSRGAMVPIPKLTLVTTTEDLKQMETPELQKLHNEAGACFAYLGPLLDKAGAKRAGGFKVDAGPKSDVEKGGTEDEVTQKLRHAKETGRPIVFGSMGTVATGDNPTLGWNGRTLGANGEPRGLSGCELCRAAWSAMFKAFGSTNADEGTLILVTVGPQPDALGDLAPPPNALCLPYMPQVDILKAEINVFLTHGGQNSFMESLSQGVPMVVCPTAGDQFDNAKKAVELGAGFDAGRPDPDPGCEKAAVEAFIDDVSAKLTEAARLDGPCRAAVKAIATRLATAGGIEAGVELILKSCSRPNL